MICKHYTQPELITDTLLQEFITQGNKDNRQVVIAYAIKLWAEEEWLTLDYTSRRYKKKTPKIETIPEEVLYQIYEKFDLFPPPLARLFRLQLVLGCRIGEMMKMPRPKCYGCSSFCPSTGKLPLYERQYQGEQQRMKEAEQAGVELAYEEAKSTLNAMDKWLPDLRRLANE